jgi:predicted NAD/FAD-binding protein
VLFAPFIARTFSCAARALAAQEKVRAMNGANSTWFTGAWLRHGFHEDGLESAVTVADAIMKKCTECELIS